MKILFLPKWYPNQNDVQHGIFIKNQALAIAKTEQVGVLFVITSELHSKDHIEITRKDNYFELIYYFPKKPNRLLALYHYYRSFSKAQDLFQKEWGFPNIVMLYILGRNYMMYKKFYGIVPFIVSEQWSGYLNGGMERYIYAKRRNTMSALKNADGIIAVSKPLAEALWKYSGGREVAVIPNIVYSKGITENKIGETIKVLAVADLVDSVKNISGMLQALQKVSKNYSIDFRIIGEGEDAKKIKKQAGSMIHDKLRISFFDRMPHDQLLDQYKECNFYLLNSYKETFCVAAAEALAAGRPVVSTHCGGPEVYLNENNAVFCDNNSVEGLATAIELMITRLKENHFTPGVISAGITEQFGADTIAKQYITQFKLALNKKS